MAEIVVKLVNGELAGKTMQQITKEVNAASTALKKAEVGTQAWVDANKKLEHAKSLQADLKKQIDSTAAASNQLKDAFFGMIPFGGQLRSMIGQFGGLKSGVGGLISSMGLLKTALISTGLGALVVLLGSLVTWFSKTERGSDLLSKAMAAAGAAVNVLTDRASKLIDALIAFTKGDWSEAANKFGEATKGVTEELVNETKAAWELNAALDALEEQEGKMILIRARTKDQIAGLRLQAKDESLSMKERAKALEQAIGLTRQLSSNEEEIAKGRALQALELINEEEVLKKYGVTLDELIQKGENILTVDNLGQGESQQKDLDNAFQALAKLSEIRKQGADEERTLITELNTLRRKTTKETTDDQTKTEKAHQEALKKKLEDEQKYLADVRDLENQQLQLMDEGREKELAQLELSLRQQFETLDKSSPLYAEKWAAAQELARKKRDEINKKWDAIDQENELAAIEEIADAKRLAATENLALQRITAQEYNEELYFIEEEALTQQLELLKAHGLETTAVYQELYARLLALRQGHNESGKKSDEENFKAAIATANDFTNALIGNYQAENAAQKAKVDRAKELYGEESDQYKSALQQYESFRKKNADRVKTVEKAQVGVNLVAEISAIWKNSAQFGPFGYILALVQTAAAALRAKSAITKIDAAQFAKGGVVLKGPSHAQGGIPIEAEGDEIILTKGVYRNPDLRNAASRINVAGGGRSFAMGGPTNPFDNPPAAASSSAIPGIGGGGEFRMLGDKLDSLGAQLAAWPTRLKVVNVATETEDVIKTVNEIRDDADV